MRCCMEWIKSELATRSTRPLPAVPLWWVSTTAPEVRLPAPVEIGVTAEAIKVHAEGMGPNGDDVDFEFPKQEIVGVEIALTPDGSFSDLRWAPSAYARSNEFSRATIRHVDPFGVEPYFESVFASHRAYWLKALASELKEKLGVVATVTRTEQISDEDIPF